MSMFDELLRGFLSKPADEIPPGQFKCERCGGVFEKDWSDEESLGEKEQLFGDFPIEDMAVVCDDCFQELMKQSGLA